MTGSGGYIAVVNHTAANIHSVDKALRSVGADARVTSDAAEILNASGVVLPGVGAIDAAMLALMSLGLVEPIKEFAASGRPLMGVCLGMQLLFEHSEEGDLPGLGLIEGTVREMKPEVNGISRKIPHMGWNAVHFTRPQDALPDAFHGTLQDTHFYFVHSYECVPANPAQIVAVTDYGSPICAIVQSGNIAGTQFHPEKSQDVGLAIYRRFVDSAIARAAEASTR
jgi:imidazole glycerol-phosphate synthase subunit HisH